jgi:aryl carrier-like protein
MSDELDAELLKIDAYTSYWQEYQSLLKEPGKESYFTDPYIDTVISVPETVLNFSKANVHNARILIAAAISKVFDCFEITEQVSVALGHQAIPLINTEKLSLADSAKRVLSHFKSHLSHLPAPEFYPAFVCIVQSEIQKKVLINLFVNETVSEIRAYIPLNFQSFTGLLLQESFNMIEQIRNANDYEPSVEIKNSFDALTRSQLPEIVYSIWAEIHSLPLQPDKSYLENGADSIQAIRFLSRLQKEGYKVELTSLLEASKIAEWQPEFIGKPISEPDYQDNYEVYPLSLNQKIIWNDWARYHQHHLYHEQFLFKLST